MQRIPKRIVILVICGLSAALFAYSIGSLVLDDLGISSRHVRSIALHCAGLIALLLALEFLSTNWATPLQDSGMPHGESFMQKTTQHKVTKADIVFSVGRGLVMAAAVIGATYFLGSWYLGGSDFDSIYQTETYSDATTTPRIEHATAPGTTTEEATQ
jgi:amino acid transporter